MTYQDCILDGKKRFEAAALECADPLLHMKQLVEAALSIDTAELLRRYGSELLAADAERVEKLVLRRLSGEPFQYIVGYEWFWDSKFDVAPGVLIPRPETERLVELALERLPPRQTRVAELGAGTGAIGISLLKERPLWEWYAWEKSPEAWTFAHRNLAILHPPGKYALVKGDFFAGVREHGPFDWFVANPPYVKRGDIAGLSREVRHEPAAALDGGESGLAIVKPLISLASEILNSGGGVLIEIGSDQGDAVLEHMKRSGLVECRIEKDLAGLDRVAYGRKV